MLEVSTLVVCAMKNTDHERQFLKWSAKVEFFLLLSAAFYSCQLWRGEAAIV